MPRKKKVKLLDQMIDSLKKKWENASIRDVVYITSYVAAVGISYKILMGLKALPAILFTDIAAYIYDKLSGKETEEPALDMEVLLTACVVAYIVLKIDMDDITAAANKITTVAASFG